MDRLYGTFLLLVLVLLGANVCNGFLMGLTYDQLWSGSDLIVLGIVSSVKTVDGVYQLKEFTVERYFKGDGAFQISIREEGGTLPDGSSLWVEDQPELGLRQRYLLFLRETGGTLRVYGGPQGAFSVEGSTAKGHSAYLAITGESLEFIWDPSIRLQKVYCNDAEVVNEPVRFMLEFQSNGGNGGHRLTTLMFRGISGEAAGTTMVKDVLGFAPANDVGLVHSYQNFTLPGVYRLEVDGTFYCEFNVTSERPTPFRFTNLTINSPITSGSDFQITLGVEIQDNTVREQRITAVIRPKTRGVDDYNVWYIDQERIIEGSYNISCLVHEPGSYTVSLWVGGVKVLTGSFEALPATPSTTETDWVAAEHTSSDYPWWVNQIGAPVIIVLAITAYLFMRYILKRKTISLLSGSKADSRVQQSTVA